MSEQPSDSDANPPAERAATLARVEEYCRDNGFPMPRLTETENGGAISFAGIGPDGRHFSFGLEGEG